MKTFSSRPIKSVQRGALNYSGQNYQRINIAPVDLSKSVVVAYMASSNSTEALSYSALLEDDSTVLITSHQSSATVRMVAFEVIEYA